MLIYLFQQIEINCFMLLVSEAICMRANFRRWSSRCCETEIVSPTYI
jgi:hypothetical protein